ncbi:putative uncharacterized protein LOC104885229 [Chlorella sorokiniana]|uniref:Uncharacterized protein n=1 Tax=Chlorella sorokiniana TaxID=3076 RepID=A0A2P6TJ65_CHLSO|nr:putative uncharacterized protein LOC104885229 [Chlorella sorokiniana]|eukprot:PRW39277.1 putative uncharacterized protein LOC104885229 [Chlorella sorokiniana]
MKALHLAILFACLAAASAASSRSLTWKHGDRCHVDNYVCVDKRNFCLGNTVMQCADGTHCKTQPEWKRADVSPCISGSSSSSSSKPKGDHKPSKGKKCGKECGKTKSDYRHAACEGKSGCHKPSNKRCHKSDYHCVDGRHFCLGDQVMRCAKGTVCKTWQVLLLMLRGATDGPA